MTTSHHLFFFRIKGVCCLKHGFILRHECHLAARLTLLKPERDLAVLMAVRSGFAATDMLVSI